MINKIKKLSDTLGSMGQERLSNQIASLIKNSQQTDLEQPKSVYLFGKDKIPLDINSHPLAKLIARVVYQAYLLAAGKEGLIRLKEVNMIADEALHYDNLLQWHEDILDNLNPITYQQFEKMLNAISYNILTKMSVDFGYDEVNAADIEFALKLIKDAYLDNYHELHSPIPEFPTVSDQPEVKNNLNPISHNLQDLPEEDMFTELL